MEELDTRKATLQAENLTLKGDIHRLSQGRLIGPLVIIVAAFFGGFTLSAVVEGSAPVDLKAEYCRGIGDGEARIYTSVRNLFIGSETDAAAAGVRVLIVAMDSNGNILQEAVISESVVSAPRPDMNLQTETACYALDLQAMIDFGVRGPSDATPAVDTKAVGK